jgi:hypothetical protein
MKKILFSLLIPAIALTLMTSCETDRDSNPKLDVSKAQEGFHLNVPANAANNTYDLLSGEKIWLTAEQPNYGGIPYMTRYYVQVSNEEAFNQFTELSTSFTNARVGIDTYEMNQAIVAMFKEKNPDTDYPNTPAPVWVRLRAIIDGYSFGESFSNIIKLPSVLANYQAPKATLPTQILIVGSSIQTAWTDWKPLAPVFGQDGKFYTMAYMPAGGQFKWGLEKGDWRGFDRIKKYDDQANAGIHEAASDGNIQIDNAGWYALLFEAEIAGSSLQYTLHVYPGKSYIIGASAGDSWDEAVDTWALSAPADASGLWESPAFGGAGELRAYIKLPGIEWWRTEFTLFKGNLFWRTVDIPQNWEANVGPDYSVKVTAGQKLYVNFDKNTGEVK